jgi:hypothetical protein
MHVQQVVYSVLQKTNEAFLLPFLSLLSQSVLPKSQVEIISIILVEFPIVFFDKNRNYKSIPPQLLVMILFCFIENYTTLENGSDS